MYDFRSYIEHLDATDRLVRISKEVDPEYQMGALIWKLEEQGKAVLFENVKGAKFPVIAGVLNGIDRFAEIHGAPDPKNFTRRDHAEVLQEALDEPIPPQVKNTGPVKEVIKTGDAVDLSELPLPTFFDGDSGAFITAAIGVSRHNDSGELNVGIYRSLMIGDKTLNINASAMSNLRGIINEGREKGESIPIALAIGNDPLVLMAAAGKPNAETSEYAVAGGLRKSPVDLVRCETSDLLVPADAEFVIEGEIDFSEEMEQTFGEFADQYGPGVNPNFRVTAITHRKDAMFHAIFGGTGKEHFTLGPISLYGLRNMICDEIKRQFPIINDVFMSMEPMTTGAMFQLTVQMDKKNDDEPNKLIEKIFQAQAGHLPISTIFKRIVVVDDDVDMSNYKDVEWAIWTRTAEASKIMVIPDVQSWEADRSAKDGKSVRLGIDATKSLEDLEKLRRPFIPGFDDVKVEDFL